VARKSRRRGADPSLLVLISLGGGPRHGHAMLRDIAEFSEQRLGPGTLYGAIERLEDDGLIEPLPAADRRTPYRLTESGTKYLRRRVAELDQLAAVARRRVAT
jgi:DNA-binding PadR family transcriptional regulator